MSRRSWRGRDDGFDAFVASTTGDLLRTASLIVWDPSVAEDVVQECLLQVARRWSRVRRMAYPAAYARRIATNLAIAAAERHSTERAELAAGLDFEPVDAAARLALEQVDHQHDLDAALGRLAPRQRAVVGAAILRGPHRGPDRRGARLLGRHGEEHVLAGPRSPPQRPPRRC